MASEFLLASPTGTIDTPICSKKQIWGAPVVLYTTPDDNNVYKYYSYHDFLIVDTNGNNRKINIKTQNQIKLITINKIDHNNTNNNQ